MSRDLIYGRRPVREALRGPREVLELWASENALKSEAWLRELDKPRVQTKLERDLSEAAGTRDHQGVVAWCEPFRYADAFELASGEAPLLACLDEVSDPRNLGAVLRSAEGAGASGVVVTAHGSAHVTPAVCRASAGAVEHVPVAVVSGIPAALERAVRAEVWTVGLAAEGTTSVFELEVADRPVMLVLGAEGRGLARLTRDRCDLLAAIPMPGAVDSLNVATASAVACFEVVRRRGATRASG